MATPTEKGPLYTASVVFLILGIVVIVVGLVMIALEPSVLHGIVTGQLVTGVALAVIGLLGLSALSWIGYNVRRERQTA